MKQSSFKLDKSLKTKQNKKQQTPPPKQQQQKKKYGTWKTSDGLSGGSME